VCVALRRDAGAWALTSGNTRRQQAQMTWNAEAADVSLWRGLAAAALSGDTSAFAGARIPKATRRGSRARS
jgi:hypothetical protein